MRRLSFQATSQRFYDLIGETLSACKVEINVSWFRKIILEDRP